MIYLDSAATTKPCEQAADAILSAMKNSFGNASSLHGMGIRSEKIIASAKKTLLAKLGEGDIIFTSERARMKVEALCEKLTDWCGSIVFYCVPFTELQEALRDNCPEELFTVLMRRLMVKIANRICAANDYGAIITGESVAQVASQTLPAIFCTNAAAEYPVFRPVIGMDKREIVDVARHIDTFEVSTLPYEDCCTVFSPKHPKTRPSLEEILAAEASFDFEPLIEKAVRETEVKQFKYGVRNVDLDM